MNISWERACLRFSAKGHQDHLLTQHTHHLFTLLCRVSWMTSFGQLPENFQERAVEIINEHDRLLLFLNMAINVDQLREQTATKEDLRRRGEVMSREPCFRRLPHRFLLSSAHCTVGQRRGASELADPF